MSCGVGRRLGSDPMLLWLWRRPVATAPNLPLAWEPPYAAGTAQEIATTTTTTTTTTNFNWSSHCGSEEMNPASTHEDVGLISVPDQWVKDQGFP